MDAEKMILLLPSSNNEERLFLKELLQGLSEEDKTVFMTQYMLRRKDPQLVLIFALIGFLGIAGIQRFMLDEIILGLLYFFTAGFCFIGTIIDIIRYKELAFEYNRKIAHLVYDSIS